MEISDSVEKAPASYTFEPVILLINGPNLNMLGKRSKEHYGSFTLAQVEEAFKTKALELGVRAAFFQSNEEGAMVSAIHDAMSYAAGIVINAGAYTHYSYAILDALLLCGLPVMEVHISNIHQREEFRHLSVIQPACVDQIYGLGLNSYLVGLERLVKEFVLPVSPVTVQPESLETSSVSLDQVRQQISAVDKQMIQLFNQRMSLAQEVAKSKIQTKKPVYDAQREGEVSLLAQSQSTPDMGTRVDALMKTLMRVSREKQYDTLMPLDQHFELGQRLKAAATSLSSIKTAAYAGTEGSYSQQAANRLFPQATKQAAHTFLAACEMVWQGKADAAVLPIENSTAGTVNDVYELLQQKNLHIVRATSIAAEHKLAVIPGTKLVHIQKVTSHPQALAQCSTIIRDQGWETIASGNTAFAPLEVAQKGDPTMAAIASAEAAQRNGLEILPVDICNNDSNQTRFIAVTKELIITPDAGRISTLMHLPHRSGALVSALQIFADRGLNLSSISSRPLATTPWEYSFFLDFDCPALGEEGLLALYQLTLEMPYIKVLGWYLEE